MKDFKVYLLLFIIASTITFSGCGGGDNPQDNPPPSTGGGNTGIGSWTATSTTSAPSGRSNYTAVWTGSEMIVWGGLDVGGTTTNTGGRYNPTTDSWTATSTTNMLFPRFGHSAVWTGTEMIVWGGDCGCGEAAALDDGGGGDVIPVDSLLNTGEKYNPAGNSWSVISAINAPTARYWHTAVWAGNEMIVWGGYTFDSINFTVSNTGGVYNPSDDSWTGTSTGANVPSARTGHTAVWTGTEMIIWGGNNFNTGGRYNLATDSWTATNPTNAPAGRVYHTAVWTGTEMIIWGGYSYEGSPNILNTGGVYNPSDDSWIQTTTINAPFGRFLHTAVWTGAEMIVWGGGVNTGGRYNPATGSWTATSTTNAPSGRVHNSAVWTGTEMIVWGGATYDGNTFTRLNTGGRYTP